MMKFTDIVHVNTLRCHELQRFNKSCFIGVSMRDLFTYSVPRSDFLYFRPNLFGRFGVYNFSIIQQIKTDPNTPIDAL